MGTKNIVFLVVVVLIATGLGGFFIVQYGSVNRLTEIRSIPELTFTDYSGKAVALSQFLGKPMVVNAWASWCPFCVEELSDFISLQEEYKDKIAVIAVNRAEPPAIAKNYTDHRGLTEKLVFLLDSPDSFYQAIGGFSMPETIFADKDGKIVFHKRGPMNLEEMRRRIEELFLWNIH